MKFRNAVFEAQAHQRTLVITNLITLLFVAYLWYGWNNSPTDITLHYPPDLSNGATQKIGEVPKPNVYTFAYYVLQKLNRCPEDCEKDLPKNIYQLSPYLSDRFKIWLTDWIEKKAKNGEIQGRMRGVQEMPGHEYSVDRVTVISEGLWEVTIDLNLEEHSNATGQSVKDINIRVPVRVVAIDVDQDQNMWGLVLDGGPEKAQRIEDEGEKKNASETKTSVPSYFQ